MLDKPMMQGAYDCFKKPFVLFFTFALLWSPLLYVVKFVVTCTGQPLHVCYIFTLTHFLKAGYTTQGWSV